jgi:hypothetical protein
MKENRSLDHNFRTLRGLRGCDDPTAATLGSDAAASWRAEQVCPRPAVGSRLSRACGRVAAP